MARRYRKDDFGFLWLPLSYQLAQQEQLPGGPYPQNITLAVHYPLPVRGSLRWAELLAAAEGSAELPSADAGGEVLYSLDGFGIDSSGKATSARSEVGSILSTM